MGVVGVGVYDVAGGIVSSSVITLAGHRENVIAKEGAEHISKYTKSATVLIVGIHVENITEKRNIYDNQELRTPSQHVTAKIKGLDKVYTIYIFCAHLPRKTLLAMA